MLSFKPIHAPFKAGPKHGIIKMNETLSNSYSSSCGKVSVQVSALKTKESLSISCISGGILVYICFLISTGFSLSDEANKMKFLNIERA